MGVLFCSQNVTPSAGNVGPYCIPHWMIVASFTLVNSSFVFVVVSLLLLFAAQKFVVLGIHCCFFLRLT